MSGTTYAQADTAWRQAKEAVESLIQAERAAAQRELDARISQLSAVANAARTTLLVASRSALVLPTPVSGLAIGRAAVDYARASGAVATAAADKTTSMAAGESLIAVLRSCVARIDTWMQDQARPAADTPVQFMRRANQWLSSQGEVNQIGQDINDRGRSSAWVSTASSDAYLTAVNPQLSAIKEMGSALRNHALACFAVARCQMEIFGMIEDRHKQAELEAATHRRRAQMRAGAGDFFGGVRAMLQCLRDLEAYLINRGHGAWRERGSEISKYLNVSVASVKTLADGWPERTEHADHVEEPTLPPVTAQG